MLSEVPHIGITLDTSESSNVSNNHVSGAYALASLSDHLIIVDASTIVSENYIYESSGCGIYVNSTGLASVIGNYISKSRGSGIQLQSSNSSVSGNFILESSSHGIYIDNSANYINITDNVIIDATNHGIYFNAASGFGIIGTPRRINFGYSIK